MRALAVVAAAGLVGCGSLRPATLLASAHHAYPDCEEIELGARAEGVTQWIVVCGEPRLFGLRPEADVARDRQRLGVRDDETFDVVLQDVGPPLQWGGATQDDAGALSSSVKAGLRPLAVEVALLAVGETSYLTLTSPEALRCDSPPAFVVQGEVRTMDSAPTETVLGSRRHVAQRIDPETLRLLSTGPFEIAVCGQPYALDEEAAAMFRRWAIERAGR